MQVTENMIPTRGEFTIETYDVNDNLIDTYNDNNRILARVPFNFSCMSYGTGCNGFGDEWPDDINLDDFKIGTLAIGTDGIDVNGDIKVIECNRNMLYSEQNLWIAQSTSTITSQIDDMNKYVYQTTFDTQANGTTDPEKMIGAVKTSEGPSFPWDIPNNLPAYYRSIPDGANGLLLEDTSMTVSSNHQELILKYEFTLGQFAGNGIWEYAPAFSEAALYMRYEPKDQTSNIDGKPLGSMFSMKTFPKQYKTEACYFRIKWNIIFGTNVCPDNQEPEITLIGDDTVEVLLDSPYEEPGYIAYDAEDGDITEDVITTGLDDLRIDILGNYVITYSVTDSAGQTVAKTRTIRVIPNSLPIITIIGADETIQIGDTYTELGATAVDVEDGDITDDIVISGSVNNMVVGDYIISYDVTDSNDGVAVTKERTVTVDSPYMFEATITEL